MARQDALSITLNGSDADKLAELKGGLIEAIQKGSVSAQIKNDQWSGDPTSGSVEVDRFKNAVVQAYGTARAAGEGNKLQNSGKVTVNIDQDKELVEELSAKDVKLFGIGSLMERRKVNQRQSLIAALDRHFFQVAEAEGSAAAVSGETLQDRLESIIQAVETTHNDWVDGVDREMLVMTVTPAVYGKLQNYIDSVPNSLTGLTDNMFHKVRIFSNHRQTKDVIVMLDGAIAQPVLIDDYQPERIGLSNDYAVTLFPSWGTKAVTPDLIRYVDDIDGESEGESESESE